MNAGIVPVPMHVGAQVFVHVLHASHTHGGSCVCEAPHFHPVQRVTVVLWPLYSQGFSLHKAHFVIVSRPEPTAGPQYVAVASCCSNTANEESLRGTALMMAEILGNALSHHLSSLSL